MEKIKNDLLTILGSEEQIRLAWNEYVEKNIETETQPKIFLNNVGDLKELLTYLSKDGVANTLFYGSMDKSHKYIYESNDRLYSVDNIFDVINSYKLYQYICSIKITKLNELVEDAKELKKMYYSRSTDEFADYSANFIDDFVRIMEEK